MSNANQQAPWWAERQVPENRGVSVCLGPLELGLHHRRGEWQLAVATSGCSYEEEPDEVRIEPVPELTDDAEILERFAVSSGGDSLRCVPVAADRSVVVRPRIPFFVAPGQEVRIYVSAPIWVRLEVGKPWQTLREVPARRLSDTWFGSPTDEGGLAYALQSHARVRLEELPERYHRAITPVLIRNRADDVLPVDRLNLPVPYLSLLATSSHRLWTEAVTMTRTEEDGLVHLKIRKGAPPEAGEARRVSEPRLVSESNVLVRAFSNLFRHAREEAG